LKKAEAVFDCKALKPCRHTRKGIPEKFLVVRSWQKAEGGR
jgi:hypothetical protein